MARRERWYQYLPAVTATVPCEGDEHHVTWRWGKFKLDDHDLAAERAMLVLGGEACGCLRALRLWASLFGMRPEQFGEMRRWMGEDAALVPRELDVPREVGMALSLERAWKKSLYLERQGPLLERFVKERALPAFRAHLTAEKQRFGARIIRGAQVRHVPANQAPAVEGRIDTVSVSATATLSSDWVVNVWARGLAEVEGGFVLEAFGPGSRPGSLAARAAVWREQPRSPGVAEPVAVALDVVRDPATAAWRLVEPLSPEA